MKKKMLLHVCTGCGAEKVLDHRFKVWCDCNPSAKFVFMVKRDRQIIHRVVGALKPSGKVRS